MASNVQVEDPHFKVLECIRNFIKEHCYAPTITEICAITGLRSKGTVAVHLRTLRALGLVIWQPCQERTLVVTDRAWAAQYIVKQYLDSRGLSADKRRQRHYLMRNVLSKPAVRAAIDELMATRNFTLQDAIDLHIAYIKGEIGTVRFLADGSYQIIKRPSYEALMDYMRMIGMK